MPLASGARIGPYEILAPLGAGGMGEIHRARDTRLGREVAIKGLPATFSNDPERLARFDREAKVLASLNHPNIGAIYGLEEAGGARYLVLELVAGETLSQRLERGPLPLHETLDVCAQIAAAIEVAHDGGIVHRDLKPANVMITPSGVVKVLDFGLAKAHEVDTMETPGSNAATRGASETVAGRILGTVPYMSPEQARGAGVDQRTDVWAFGCIVLECLTGRPAFSGDTATDVLARILEREPDWAALPSTTPARLRDIARRCLIKSAAERPRDIGDLRREIAAIARESAAGSFPPTQAPIRSTPSLAVLYFENLASDKENEYFCAGVTEDILTDLSKINGLRVASRNAVARYRGAPVDVARVAADLGVTAVLEGSVRRSGERVRITAQLINASDGFHLWAERYDRTLQDVFSVQEEIASSIAAALSIKLSPAESKQIVQDRPIDARAYDLYLKGREAYFLYTGESIHRALVLFHEAIAIDPAYALAWAGVADCYGQMVHWRTEGVREENLRLGLEAAERAIALSPRLPEAFKAKSLVLLGMGNNQEARAAIEKALELNPRFTPGLVNLGVTTVGSGDLAGAERLMRRALDVDPQEPFAATWICALAVLVGRHDEALALAERLRRFTEDRHYMTVVNVMALWIRLIEGDWKGAESLIPGALADGTDDASIACARAMIAARSGRTQEARRLIAEIDGTHVRTIGGGMLLMAAGAALSIGDKAAALRILAREHHKNLAPVLVRLDRQLHPLLDEPPFAPRRCNLTLVWPLEAPKIPPAVHSLFREVRIEPGNPESDAS